jgi:hypothetical protein
MPNYRVVFEVANRNSTIVTAPNAALAEKKVYDSALGDEMPGQANPQPSLKREVKHIKTRRTVVSSTEIP